MERLERDLGLNNELLTPIANDEQDQLMRCIVAGQIDQLWVVDDLGKAVHVATKQQRELSNSTVVRNPKLIAGTPFDLQVPTRSGGLETLNLVQGITAVQTDWLIDLAPELFASRRGKLFYDPRSGMLATRQLVRFGGQVLEGSSTPLTDDSTENKRLFVEAFASWAYEQLEKERRVLGRYHSKRIPAVPLRQLQQQVKAIAHGVIALDQLPSQQKIAMMNLAKLHTHLGADFMTKLSSSHRHAPHAHEHRHRGWQPPHKRKYDRHR